MDYFNGTTNSSLDYHYQAYYADGYSMYGFDYVYDDHLFQIFEFEIPIYGYILPILVILTSLCNLFVIGGFLRRRMRKSPTNVLLVSIAISDSLTGLVTLPAIFYVYAGHQEFLTKEWCNVSMITRLYISRSFHTISVWQTLLLGIHRYLQIRHPTAAQKFCSMKRTLGTIASIYIMGFVLHVYHAFDIKAVNGFCHWEVEVPCRWTCVYIWLALLFVHVLPCIILAVLAFLMIKTIREINFNSLTNSSSKQAQKNRAVTVVVILVVVIFLIPELPYGVFYLIVVSLTHSNKTLLPLRTNRMFFCVYELLLVVSFHLNFWVYCVFMRRFRTFLKAVLRLFVCDPVSFRRLENEHTSSSGKGLELEKVGTEVYTE